MKRFRNSLNAHKLWYGYPVNGSLYSATLPVMMHLLSGGFCKAELLFCKQEGIASLWVNVIVSYVPRRDKYRIHELSALFFTLIAPFKLFLSFSTYF